ncbi:hypothetical protein ACPOL_5078 [Acidisarcina polymorpha]|uniref:Uncharacterized protein n=1 Tax=Acidisarcina polymorpha TaxID=2211140 RepID=A0A2Z5G6N8_9BACT|nr:hypothetical protein [Acidisarcina polymorpha]AXC14334.1 hypothetical protein ACPOL_5078 [Acidisarcina polymorpha]
MAGGNKARKLTFVISVYLALPITLVLTGLAFWMVGVENATLILQSAESPDGRYRAEVVREDPGASSSYNFMVRLTPANLTSLGEKLRLLPFGPQYIALNVHHEPDQLTVRWSSTEQLIILCNGCNGAIPGRTKWRNIQLDYEFR